MLKKIVSVLLSLTLWFAIFVAGAATMYYKPEIFGIENNKATVVNDNNKEDNFDFELPGEVEKSIITVEDVKIKLDELSEFSTYMGTYTVTIAKDEMRYIFEKHGIPWTKNSIQITCDGMIKVGYDFNKIKIRVDDSKIYIALPEPRVNDNYVIWDSIKCTESNNIFNPIEFSQYQELVSEIEEKGLNEAENDGIYELAEENIRVLIGGFLSELSDYEIVYL